jgi:hypothetical protein
MQMAAPVVANEFVGHGNQEESKPRPSKSERVGHPEEQSPKKQSQYRRVDVLKWYHPTVRAVDRKMRERVGHPRKDAPAAGRESSSQLGIAAA